jgi:hypothetical protein
MSFNRENVVFQSADGTWSRCFYAVFDSPRHDDDDDFDPEWDVDYDFGEFRWASVGHRTSDDAYASWEGANPGGSHHHEYDLSDPVGMADIEQFEDMVAELCERERSPGGHNTGNFKGPDRLRSIKAMSKELARLELDHWRYRLRGLDNEPSPKIEPLRTKLVSRLRTASPADRAIYDATRVDLATQLGEVMASAVKEDQEGSWRITRGLLEQRIPGRIEEAKVRLTELASEAKPPAAARPAAPSRSGSRRGKTTPGSTPGSFAPVVRDEPTGGLG